MKFFLTTLFASVAVVSAIPKRKLQEGGGSLGNGSDAASNLAAKWFMTNPQIDYDPVTNIFELNFPDSSPLMVAANMQERFYDAGCRWDGETSEDLFKEYELGPDKGIVHPDDTDLTMEPVMTQVAGRPQLKFKIDTATVTKDTRLYETVTAQLVGLQRDPTAASPWSTAP